MTTQEIIKDLCQKKGITIKTLEKELGFSNGSIMKTEHLRSDRLLAISKFFNVSMEYLMGIKDENDNLLRAVTLTEYEDMMKAEEKFFYNYVIETMGYKIDYHGGKYYLLAHQDEYGDYRWRVSLTPEEIETFNSDINKYIHFTISNLYAEKKQTEEKVLVS